MEQNDKKIKKPEEKKEMISLLEDWPSFCARQRALNDSWRKVIPTFRQEPESKQENQRRGEIFV
jgi:hypothetical protein